MTSIAVVTATTGRAELQRAIDSVAAQTVPCRHYVFADGVDVPPVSGVEFCRLPVVTGGAGLDSCSATYGTVTACESAQQSRSLLGVQQHRAYLALVIR